jgi:hypothetical protein
MSFLLPQGTVQHLILPWCASPFLEEEKEKMQVRSEGSDL